LIRQGHWRETAGLLCRGARLPQMGVRGMLRELKWLPPGTGLRTQVKRWGRGRVGQTWLNAGWFRDRGVVGGAPPKRPSDGDVLRHELHRSLVRTSLPQLLRYEDRNSMAHSIESRVPFLTPALAQFILALPEEYLVAPDGTSKRIFREAMR